MTTSCRSFLASLLSLAAAAAVLMPWRKVRAKSASKLFTPDQLPSLSQWMRPVDGVMTLSHYDRDGVEVRRQTFPGVTAWYDWSNS